MDEDVFATVVGVRSQLAALEAEASALKSQGELDWEGAQDPGVLEQAIEAERRLSQIPAQVKAARIKATELEIEALELEQAAAEKRVTDLYSEWEEANRQLQEAQQLAASARGRWYDARYHVSDLRREIDRLKDKVLYNLKREPVTEAQKGPVVRAAWLASQYDAGTEEGVEGDAPASFAFGSANVSDPPLSTGQPERARQTAVIPERALREHAKGKGNDRGEGGHG